MTNLIAFLMMVGAMMGEPSYTENTIKQAEIKCEHHGGPSNVWADGVAICEDGTTKQ